MATIAIVTSTTFGSDNAACFKSGLSSSLGGNPQPTILPPFQSPNGSYDLATLQPLIRSAVNNNPGPDLIVTAGGLPTAMAAAAELTHPNDPKFIFLIGDALGGNPTALAGGVNMNNPSEDTARKKLLTDPPFNVAPGKLYLVVNSNINASPMSHNDAHNWPPAKVAKFFNGVPNPPDPTATFNTEFTNLKNSNPTPEGLVISADPYFRLWRTAFTAALGSILPVPVCYPFQDFIDAINNQPNTPNIHNSVALEQPKLNNPNDSSDASTAYFQLGKQTGRFLAGTANVKVVNWDAANSTWSQPS